MTTLSSLILVFAMLTPSPVASYACQADTKFGRHTLSLRQAVDAKAPVTVRPNSRFTVAVDLEPGQLPSDVKGFKLQEVRDLSLKIPVPANSSFVSAQLTGGLGGSVRVEGSNVVVSVPGPISGGASYQLPTLAVRLKAGRRGTTVQTKLAGSSFDNPGLTLQAKIKWKFVTLKAPVACYPDPNPALTQTRIQ